MDFDGVSAIGFANSACPDAACTAESGDLRGVLGFLRESGAIDTQTEAGLLERYGHTAEGEKAAASILEFRAVVVRALEALRSGDELPADVLEAINKELAGCGCARRLVREGDTYRTTTLFQVREPKDVLMPIAHSLAEIVTSVPSGRLKQCREARCSCYFIDTSKNGTRAWCSMQRCGNRQKVANYYRRERERERASEGEI